MKAIHDTVARSERDRSIKTSRAAVLWSRLLWLTLAYFAVAQLSLWLAFTSTLAVPLWPAVGPGLRGLLVLGCRYWPAIWLGAFASELLSRSIALGNGATATLVALSATIAVGVVLQAMFGARLMRPFVASTEPLEQEREVFAALVLGGPLASLVSATLPGAAARIANNAEVHHVKEITCA